MASGTANRPSGQITSNVRRSVVDFPPLSVAWKSRTDSRVLTLGTHRYSRKLWRRNQREYHGEDEELAWLVPGPELWKWRKRLEW